MTTKNAETTTTNRNDVRELTRAEIRRQVAIHSARRRENHRGASGPLPQPRAAMSASPAIGDDERAAREHAKSLLNGNAPELLSVPPALSRDRILNSRGARPRPRPKNSRGPGPCGARSRIRVVRRGTRRRIAHAMPRNNFGRGPIGGARSPCATITLRVRLPSRGEAAACQRNRGPADLRDLARRAH